VKGHLTDSKHKTREGNIIVRNNKEKKVCDLGWRRRGDLAH